MQSADAGDSDSEIDLENTPNLSSKPSCIPNSFLPHKRNRLINWSQNNIEMARKEVDELKKSLNQFIFDFKNIKLWPNF